MNISKVLLQFIFFALLHYACWADDAYIFFGSGSVTVSPPNPLMVADIAMASERIRITLFDSYYKVDVDYLFENRGEAVELDVGFPIREVRADGKVEFDRIIPDSFSTTVNGRPSQFELVKSSSVQGIAAWFTKKVNFSGYSSTRINTAYRSNYGESFMQKNATYYFGTGSTWSGPIGEVALVVENRSKWWLNGFSTYFKAKKPRIEVSGLESTMFTYHSIEPGFTDEFRLGLEYFPDDGILDGGISSHRATRDAIYLLTSAQLRILRNAFYAQRGMIFKSGDLKNFFEQKRSGKAVFSWYRPESSSVDEKLTEDDRLGIKLIQEMERLRQRKGSVISEESET